MVAVSQTPSLIPEPFANSAAGTLVNSIPDTVAGGSGLASWHLGWQLINGQPLGSGGIPPDLQDENGLLQQISAIVQWLAIGGPFPWSSAVANIAGLTGTYGSNGGYPNGAVVPSATTPGRMWRSTADNNTSNPDTGGANWQEMFTQSGTGTINGAGVISYPLAFVNTPVVVVCGAQGDPSGDISVWHVSSVGTSTFIVDGETWNGTNWVGITGGVFNWIATTN